MGLNDELKSQVWKIAQERWSVRDGRVVPGPTDLKFSNDGVRLDAVCLYADLADSTKLVSKADDTVAAEVFRCFLYCSAKIISQLGGTVTAYDGDRVMAVYIGDKRFENAVRTGWAIAHAVKNIVVPAFTNKQLGGYAIAHGVGIDAGKILVARSGFRNADDLIWLGPAANFAAKMSALRDEGFTTWVSEAVHKGMPAHYHKGGDGSELWSARNWPPQGKTVYASSLPWPLD
jgi:class 3 adenylate cyclase